MTEHKNPVRIRRFLEDFDLSALYDFLPKNMAKFKFLIEYFSIIFVLMNS